MLTVWANINGPLLSRGFAWAHPLAHKTVDGRRMHGVACVMKVLNEDTASARVCQRLYDAI